jgi:hypothetical protein
MTSYSKVKQTAVSLEGVKTTLEMYSQVAQTEDARNTFRRNAQRLETILERLNRRLQSMEFEEPQYKGN